MKRSSNKITVFSSRYLAHSVYPNATWMSNDFAYHMLRRLIAGSAVFLHGELCVGLPAYRPFGDVVGPLKRVNAGRGITVSKHNGSVKKGVACGRVL